MRMSRDQWNELVAHAREDAPNECCGYGRARDGLIDRVERAVNERKSPYGYDVDSKSLYEAYRWEEDGWDIVIYHSHPKSPAEPSQTDINLASYPNWLYVIVSLEGEPDVRAWRIKDRKVEEEQIVVE
jgi:proteasome lid subunit RPN8/RPN11